MEYSSKTSSSSGSASSSHHQGHNFFGAGLECQESFRRWWSLARQSEEPPSPYDFLINMGLQTKFVKTILRSMLKHSYKHKPSREYGMKGFPDYMAYHCSKGRTRLARNQKEDILQDALEIYDRRKSPAIPQEDYPTEQDILALAEVTNPKDWNKVLQLCFQRDVSVNFLYSMVGKIPANALQKLSLGPIYYYYRRRPGMRLAFDGDCLSAINVLLPKLKSIYLEPRVWTLQSLAGFLKSMLQSKSLQKVELGLPTVILNEGDDDDSSYSPSSENDDYDDDDSEKSDSDGGDDDDEDDADSAAGTSTTAFSMPWDDIDPRSSCCTVKELSLDLNRDWNNIRSFDEAELLELQPTLFLDCIAYMPQLQTLDIQVHGCPTHHHRLLPTIAPYILKAMETSLQHLSLLSSTHDNETAKSALVSILEALRGNTSLESFTFQEKFTSTTYGLLGPFLPWHLFEDKLLEIVERHNTTLGTLNLWDSFDYKDYRHLYYRDTPKWKKIQFCVNLNKCGRKKAQDPKLKTTDFVALLASVGESLAEDDIDVKSEKEESDEEESDEDDLLEFSLEFLLEREEKRRSLRDFNSMYGLLMERPSLWSTGTPGSVAGASRQMAGSRKRKRSEKP